MRVYVVSAKRWAKGWELHYEGQAVTQVRTLAKAEDQFRDWIATVEDRDPVTDRIVIVPELGVDSSRIADVRERTRQAQEAQRVAAADFRGLARDLRESEGLSDADTAFVLGVSRERLAQLG